MQIEEKVAVVTGGASGIGFAIATEFGVAGARVVLLDIENEALDSAVASLRGDGVEAYGHRVDVRRSSEVNAVAATISAELGGTDIFCNNAGVLAAPGF